MRNHLNDKKRKKSQNPLIARPEFFYSLIFGGRKKKSQNLLIARPEFFYLLIFGGSWRVLGVSPGRCAVQIFPSARPWAELVAAPQGCRRGGFLWETAPPTSPRFLKGILLEIQQHLQKNGFKMELQVKDEYTNG